MILFRKIQKNKDFFNTMFREGIVNFTTVRYFEMYQFYLDARELGTKSAAIALAASYFNTHISVIYRAIKLMESDISSHKAAK